MGRRSAGRLIKGLRARAWALALLVTALLSTTIGAGAAGAAAVSSSDGVLRVTDAQSERNIIFLFPPADRTQNRDQVIVDSSDGTLVAGPGCTEVPPSQSFDQELLCSRGERMTLEARLGGGDDTIDVYPDVPYDSGTLDGGPGNDHLFSGPNGPDEFIGGPGFDTVGFDYPPGQGVTATIDGRPDDGGPGEGDNIHTDVESLNGGFGNDRLYGTDGANWINGGLGDDVIVGGAGDDSLSGDQGNDQIDGGPGQDRLDGAEYPHYQSPDTLECGDGFDYVALDRYDTQTGCENGQYPMGDGAPWSSQAPAGTPPPGWVPPLEPAPPIPKIAPRGTLDQRASTAGLIARCSSSEPVACRGRVVIEGSGHRRLGGTRFRLARGARKTLHVHLTAYGRHATRGHRTVRVTAIVTPRGGGGGHRFRVTLRGATR